MANSAPPFNIILSDDLGGGSYLPTFNARPAFASSLSNPANVVSTAWGNFDTVPVAGETIIPPNYGIGYGQFTANLRLSKTFAFGKKCKAETSAGVEVRAVAEGLAPEGSAAWARRQYIWPPQHPQPPVQPHL